MNRTRVRWRRLAVITLAAWLGLYLFGVRAGAGTARPSPRHIYVVQPGDTVWAIARRSVGPGGDPRFLVDRLIQMNGLHGALVLPGEQLVMPGRAPSSGSR